MARQDGRSERARLEQAETLAIEALGTLAQDAEKLSDFLTLAGIEPSHLREAASAPGFLQAVLDFICQDPDLLAEVGHCVNRSPEEIDRARQILAGPGFDWGA